MKAVAEPGVLPDDRLRVSTIAWRWPWLWLALGMAGVIGLYAAHAMGASLSIDGVRWFWLDDDQMISMRYARNLVEGHGLVWNAGERVEGYTNFGWVMLMAAVHLLPLPDRLMPLAMTVVSGLICLGVVALSARLLERLEPHLMSLTLPVVLVGIVGCTDVMFWAVSGFETVLVTALHLTVVLLAVSRRSLDARLLVALALLPIIRSDGLHIWLGDAVLAFAMAHDKRRVGLLLLATLAPFAVHLNFRLAYYGELMPNTYYLKVLGLEDGWGRGLTYVRGFVERYGVVMLLALAGVAALWRRDRRALSLITSLLPPLAYAVTVGGDSFGNFRFFAHVMPELMIWAAVGGVGLVTAPVARGAWLLAPLAAALPRLVNPLAELVPVATNGDPFEQIVVASQLLKNASPDASVAVIPAGIVPYFTRLYAIDLLGKNDAHIARLMPQKGALVGHGKIDAAYSFGMRPDYLVSCRPLGYTAALAPIGPEGSPDYVRALLASPEFQEGWRSNPLPDPYLVQYSAVYVGSHSPELVRLADWQGVTLAR